MLTVGRFALGPVRRGRPSASYRSERVCMPVGIAMAVSAKPACQLSFGSFVLLTIFPKHVHFVCIWGNRAADFFGSLFKGHVQFVAFCFKVFLTK